MYINLNLFPTQEKAFMSKKKFVILGSGTGYGKTWPLAIWLVLKAFESNGKPLIAAGPTLKHCRKNLWNNYIIKFLRRQPPYCDVEIDGEYHNFVDHDLVEGVDWIWNKQDTSIYFPPSGATMYGAGFNEPDSMQGQHCHAIGADELGIAKTAEPFDVLRQRLGFAEDAQLFVTTTPYNWGPLKTQFFDPWVEAEESGALDDLNIDYFQVKSIDNPYYSEEHYWAEKEKMPQWKWNMLYNGMFTKPAGLVYKDVTIVKHEDYPFDSHAEKLHDWLVTGGVDFGFNAPTAIHWVAENLKTRQCFVFDEHYERGMDLDRIEAILRLRPCTYYGDAAQAGEIATLKNHGIDIRPADKGPGSVEAGIRLLDSEFRSGKLKVFDNCVHLIREIGLYSYALDVNGEPLDKIVKDNDHGLDDLRYNRYSQREAVVNPTYNRVGGKRLSRNVMKRFMER